MKYPDDWLAEFRVHCVCRNPLYGQKLCLIHLTSLDVPRLLPNHADSWDSDEQIGDPPPSNARWSHMDAGPNLVYYGPVNWDAIAEVAPRFTLENNNRPFIPGRPGPPDIDVGYVYHLLDYCDRFLYIGKSIQPAVRIGDHTNRAWWPSVFRVRIISSSEYHLLEDADIAKFRPRFNAGVTAPVDPYYRAASKIVDETFARLSR